MSVRMAPRLRIVAIVAGAASLTLALVALGFLRSQRSSEVFPERPAPAAAVADPSRPPVKFGVSINEPKAFQGYTLIAPVKANETFLIDMQGRVVRMWQHETTPALGASLLDNGRFLRTGALQGVPGDDGPGAGGLIQQFVWGGELVWDYKLATPTRLPHHDVTRLPNGNVLLIVFDRKSRKEAIAAGRHPELADHTFLLADSLIEIKPTGIDTGEIVWEWHLWDHVIQDHDASKANYGNVADHPELADLNYHKNVLGMIATKPGGLDMLRSIGYVGGSSTGKPPRFDPFWSHLNSIAYNAEHDRISVTSLTFSEFWIIDHSTTPAEAAGHKGGRGGKGGDILYRWGNPAAYRAGDKARQRLFSAHDAHWIPRGLPGEGRMLVFNNGSDRPDGNYSSVEELALPVDSQGRYTRPAESAFGPEQPIWSYSAANKSDFYSALFSGAQRLPNGNTLICSGSNGTLLEVTPDKEIVWKFVNPTKGSYGRKGFGPPGGGSLFRAYRYAKDHPGLAGKELKPGQTIEESLGIESEARMAR